MIDIEQHALRAFEQYAIAPPAGVAQAFPNGLDIGQHGRGHIGQLLLQFRGIHRRHTKAGAQGIVMGEQAFELRAYFIQMRQIDDAQRPAAHLVFIGRADATPCGADLAGAHRIFPQRIQIAVQRQDERAGFRNGQIVRRDIHAHAGNAGDFVAEMPGIEHHAIADHRQGAAHDARRQQRQLVDFFAHNQRVAGVVAALKAHHHISAGREPIDNLALAFIAPLGTHHGHIRHVQSCPQRT